MELLAITDAVAIQLLGTVTAVVTILGGVAVAYINLRKQMLEIQKQSEKTSKDMANLEVNTNNKMTLLLEATKIASEAVGADKERDRERARKEANNAQDIAVKAVKNMDVEHLTVEELTDPNNRK